MRIRITGIRPMKIAFAFFCAAVLLLLPQGDSQASWLIDEAAFHISAHGRFPCEECHENKTARAGHPSPAKVNKSISDFFEKNRCTQCHETVEQDLQRDFHGKKHIPVGSRYDNCIACHDPHTQLSLAAVRAGDVDPRLDPLKQCSSCHDFKERLPPVKKKQQECLQCHSSAIVRKEGPDPLCFYCHEKDSPGALQGRLGNAPLISAVQYSKTAHADVSCLACHPGAAAYGHGSQSKGDCSSCHSPHHEKIAGDAHMPVTCQACHLPGIKPEKDTASRLILWKRPRLEGKVSEIHAMIRASKDDDCKRCHVRGNTLGAAAWVLPAKGVLCIPCHAATFSASDTFTLLGLIIFLAGVVVSSSYVFSFLRQRDASTEASKGKDPSRHKNEPHFRGLFAAVLLDTLFQRRLFRHSPHRWFVHALVFYGFAFRFLWGMTALLASLAEPPWLALRFMLDKNNPATGLFFDTTGLMILAGLCLMAIRGLREKTLPDLPKSDIKAVAIIGVLVIAGFIAEGIRIAMTGFREGSHHSFAGFFLAGLFAGLPEAEEIYGYIWYLHAALTVAFVAYIPFSRLFHIVISPIALALGALKRH